MYKVVTKADDYGLLIKLINILKRVKFIYFPALLTQMMHGQIKEIHLPILASPPAIYFRPVYLHDTIDQGKFSSYIGSVVKLTQGLEFQAFSKDGYQFYTWKQERPQSLKSNWNYPPEPYMVRHAVGMDSSLAIVMSADFFGPVSDIEDKLINMSNGKAMSLEYNISEFFETLAKGLEAYERRFGEMPLMHAATVMATQEEEGNRRAYLTLNIAPITTSDLNAETVAHPDGSQELAFSYEPYKSLAEFLVPESFTQKLPNYLYTNSDFEEFHGIVKIEQAPEQLFAVSRGGFGAMDDAFGNDLEEEVEKCFKSAKLIADLFDTRYQ